LLLSPPSTGKAAIAGKVAVARTGHLRQLRSLQGLDWDSKASGD
jgi:hypothetical protein